MLIPESFKYLQVLIFYLLIMFGLRDIDPFLVLQLITDVVTINRPDMVEDLLPSLPHLICSPFISVVKDMVPKGTAQPLFLIISVIYMTGLAFASPVTSSSAHSAASMYSTLFASSTHASVEVRSLLSSSDVSCIGLIVSLVVQCVFYWFDHLYCRPDVSPLLSS